MKMEYEFDVKAADDCITAYAGSIGLGCFLADNNNNVLYQAGYNCSTCRICREAGIDKKSCIQSQLYGLEEAQRFGGKYIYFCPFGLTCFVSPIMSSSHCSARITAGPFLMVKSEDFIKCDLIDYMKLKDDALSYTIQELKNIPVISPEKANYLSTMLFMSTGFINKVSSTAHMLDQQEAETIQGQIGEFIKQAKKNSRMQYPFEMEQKLMHAMMQVDKNQAQHILNELSGYILVDSAGNIDEVKTRIFELLVLISRTSIEAGANPESTLHMNHQYRKEMDQIDNVNELFLWLKRVVIDGYMNSVFSNIDSKHSDAIHKAIQYMWENAGAKITLNQMAEMTFMSSAYFSRIFKKEFGESFNKYLTLLRIAKAQEMLLYSNRRITDISTICGFEDQSYFTKVFKKATGLTPFHYRASKGLEATANQNRNGDTYI